MPLAEVQNIAEKRSLGTATAVYQMLSYVGFAFPFVLSLGHDVGGYSPTTLLIGACVIAMVVTAWVAAITATYTHRKVTT